MCSQVNLSASPTTVPQCVAAAGNNAERDVGTALESIQIETELCWQAQGSSLVTGNGEDLFPKGSAQRDDLISVRTNAYVLRYVARLKNYRLMISMFPSRRYNGGYACAP